MLKRKKAQARRMGMDLPLRAVRRLVIGPAAVVVGSDFGHA
jgi:hypothetical protein